MGMRLWSKHTFCSAVWDAMWYVEWLHKHGFDAAESGRLDAHNTPSIECFSQINMQMLCAGFLRSTKIVKMFALLYLLEKLIFLVKRGIVAAINSLIDDKNLLRMVKYCDSLANLANKKVVFPSIQEYKTPFSSENNDFSIPKTTS